MLYSQFKVGQGTKKGVLGFSIISNRHYLQDHSKQKLKMRKKKKKKISLQTRINKEEKIYFKKRMWLYFSSFAKHTVTVCIDTILVLFFLIPILPLIFSFFTTTLQKKKLYQYALSINCGNKGKWITQCFGPILPPFLLASHFTPHLQKGDLGRGTPGSRKGIQIV